MPYIKCTHLRVSDVPPMPRCTFRKLATYTPPSRPLWVDDASYAAYQAHDPYADYNPMQSLYVATIYTGDYCNGGQYVWHEKGCQKAPVDDTPF
jgi:hypothetical protein